jgi:hypothetical protein
VHPKLAWVEMMRASVSEAMDTSIVATQRDHVDPLKKFVVLDLGRPLTKNTYNPLQVMVHAYSKANDCIVIAIRREGEKRLVLEVLIKNRVSEPMKNDPFLRDKAKQPKEG